MIIIILILIKIKDKVNCFQEKMFKNFYKLIKDKILQINWKEVHKYKDLQ